MQQDRDISVKAENYIEKNHRRRIWHRIVSALACVVVFCTTYALILPAITMEHAYCGFEEHIHSTECYEQEVTTSLICGLEEAEAHSHHDQCYEIIPAVEGHSHTDACYEETLSCGLEESEGTPEQKNLICSLEETEGHTHGEECKEEVSTPTDELKCTIEEHSHMDICYSNANADLETAEDWEATLPKTLSGEWREDIIAIAKTQIGYTESEENYTVTEDGTRKGYTRYGDWYNNKYGDWCAMFVSFCLNYAGVEKEVMPQDAGCQNWIDKLSKEEYHLYHEAGSKYEPQVGDLIFFNWDDEADADHVGIIIEMKEAEGETPATIRTIEGNVSNQVQYREYKISDGEILGYAEIPAQEFNCGQTGHVHRSECKDADGNYICGLEEHVHEGLCSAEPLTEAEQKEVDEVIELIDALPAYEEVEEKLLAYEEAEDMDGYEAYYMEIGQQGRAAYEAYEDLSGNQKLYVENYQRLEDLAGIWSAVELDVDGITSDTPTPTWYTSTKDFVELNLYDYNYNINSNWENDKKYPGFQWNGGAYAKSEYKYYYEYADVGIANNITDRYRIDSIDFGNSMITNFQYQGSNYQKSTTAVSVGKLYNNSGASETGKINWLWYDGNDYGTTTNRPVGLSTGYASIKDTLVDGYPALTDGTSLKYLFTNGTAVTKQNTESIDGLFQQDPVSGEYSYNSRTNHAQYSNNKFTLYDEIITPNFITYPFGNFLPLNSITDNTVSTQVSAFNYSGGVKAYIEGMIADMQEAIDRDDDGNGTTADYGDTSREQLITMLREYQENWNWFPSSKYGDGSVNFNDLTAAIAIQDYFTGGGDNPSDNVGFVTDEHLKRMYNIDWDAATNFFFGMEMKMKFMMPKDGMTGNDVGDNSNAINASTNTRPGDPDGIADYPMNFYFTGDDDVWVYIDEKLTLDLTGIHRHVGGSIDFVNGLVHYYELDVENGGDVSATPYKTVGFESIFPADSLVTKTATRANDSSIAADSGLRGTAVQTFKDYSTHAFNFYYTERGSGSSVCRLNFNFPLLKKNSITVTKENAPDADVELAGNPDYYFNIVTPDNELFVGPESVTGVTSYKILDSSGNEVGTGTVDQYGIFTLKADQTAVFEGIEENEGLFFVQELIKEEDNAQYDDTPDGTSNNVMVNGAEARYGKLIDWSCRTYFTDNDSDNTTGPYGYRWYGYSGEDTDASSNSTFYFEAKNGVITDKLGSLSITKKLKDVEDSQVGKTYKMYVTLDNAPLKEGTTYTIGSATDPIPIGVDEYGTYVEVAAGEIAFIENILSGTEFKIWEAAASSEGYSVEYTASNADSVDTSDNVSIKGIVRESTTVAVIVTNSGNGAPVSIVGTKSIPNYDGNEYTFKFQIEQVADKDGNALETTGITGEASATVSKDNPTATFTFPLKCTEEDVGQYYYFKVTEIVGSAGDNLFVYDTRSYIAEITATKDAQGVLSASVTKIYSGTDGTEVEEIVFENTLLSNLAIGKTVSGRENDETPFTFAVVMEDASENAITKTLSLETTNKDSVTTTTEMIYDTEQKAYIITLQDGEQAVIKGIPYGSKWTVTETFESTEQNGYIPSYQIGTSESVNGATASGSIITGGNVVEFTNTATYSLPETGGAGTNSYIIGGWLLMITAGFLLLYKNFKRGKEVI